MNTLHLNLRSQTLQTDQNGRNEWAIHLNSQDLPAEKTCILVCDMWDQHWSRGASERVDQMVPRMNAVLKAARARGCAIIHAPSETMEFYTGHPARERMLSLPKIDPPRPARHANPPLPIHDSDGGSDTGEKPWFKAWTRQHAAIEIDPGCDGISDDGREIYTFIHQRGIERVLLVGVHTNMCILNRSFAIKQMVRWRVPIALLRDLTDTMYNPAMPPYVSHAEGTRLVIEYIEKFWCPTISSEDLITPA
jgi:nicotinamidase-related amidase